MHVVSHAPRTFFSHLIKSKSVERCQLCLTVCMENHSLRLGGSLETAWLNGLTLFRSSLYKDLKTPPAEEKLINLSELYILTGEKVLSLSRCALTKARGCKNFCCNVASFVFVLPVTSVFNFEYHL